MDEKRKKDLQAVAAALIVSDYCSSMRECGDGCIFATRAGEEVLPCGLREICTPAYWSEPGGGYLEQLIKEVTQ